MEALGVPTGQLRKTQPVRAGYKSRDAPDCGVWCQMCWVYSTVLYNELVQFVVNTIQAGARKFVTVVSWQKLCYFIKETNMVTMFSTAISFQWNYCT